MAVTTDFDISKRTPEWLKKMFSTVTKSERNVPVFRFFMDLGDAVSHVKKLNIASRVVGDFPLDLAYEHFKVMPPNKLLNSMPPSCKNAKGGGHPCFLCPKIAFATADGIKCDDGMLLLMA